MTLFESDNPGPLQALLLILQYIFVAYMALASTLSGIYLVYLVAKFPLECWRWLQLNRHSLDAIVFGRRTPAVNKKRD